MVLVNGDWYALGDAHSRHPTHYGGHS